MNTTSYHIKSPQDWHKIAPKLLQQADKLRIWYLRGNLGSGKTTLVKALCRHLGVKETITSPTFTLMHQYTTHHQQKVNHFDFYRLKEVQSVLNLGFEDLLHSNEYLFIEWPQIIKNAMQSDYFDIEITLEKNQQRIIQAKKILKSSSSIQNKRCY